MGGKHRAPTESQVGPRLIKFGAVIVMASTPMAFNGASASAATTDNTSILEAIAKCESGNKNVNNNTVRGSTASGYLQILDSTWRAFGGTEFAQRAIHAARSEQFVIGARILAGQGIGAWNPSRACWGSKIKTARPTTTITPEPKKYQVAPPKKITPKTIVKKITPPPTRPPLHSHSSLNHLAKKATGSYLIRRGDTLSKIAAAHHINGGWKSLYKLNSDTVKNPHWIYAGHHLRLR